MEFLFAVLVCAVLGGLWWWTGRTRATTVHDEDTPFDQLLVPVEHHGADADWSPAASVAVDPHPLDLSVPLAFGEDLVPAHFFDDLMALRPVVLDYPEISFTSEWALAGARLGELADTELMPAVRA